MRKTEHFRISRRDTLVNDLKNSTVEGLGSLGLSVVALILLIASILISYTQACRSGVLLGLIPLFAFLLSAAAVIFAGFGFRRKDKVRHYMEKRGLIIALVSIAGLLYLYIRGLIIVLEKLQGV